MAETTPCTCIEAAFKEWNGGDTSGECRPPFVKVAHAVRQAAGIPGSSAAIWQKVRRDGPVGPEVRTLFKFKDDRVLVVGVSFVVGDSGAIFSMAETWFLSAGQVGAPEERRFLATSIGDELAKVNRLLTQGAASLAA